MSRQRRQEQQKLNDLRTLLQWMCEVWRPTMIRPVGQGGVGWQSADCIRQTKMAMAMLRSFGCDPVELPVSLYVCNPTMAKALDRQGVPLVDCEAVQYPDHLRGQLHVVAMSARPGFLPITPEGSWRGHLICVVERRFLLDITLDSVNDAVQDIAVKPTFIDMEPNGLRRFISFGETYEIRTDRGEIISYRHDPDNKHYLGLDTWRAWHGVHDRVLEQARTLFLRHLHGQAV